MAPEVIPFPMQHMSGRGERPALVGDPDGPKSSLSPQDDCPLPTPQRQSVAVTGQAPIAMFENAKNIIINGGQFTQTISMLNSSSSASDTKPQSHNISDLYQRNMASLRAGTALWIPEGHSNSAWFSYRGEGVSIGDVGIVTPSGSFSVLFNICLPAGHPVNRNGVPRGFKSINPAIDPCDIREIHEFMPMDFLSTDSITRLAGSSDDSTPISPLISFHAQEGDGALVVMPEGAVSQDLENVSKFRSYAAANIEDWYHYANITRGREIENGELRLVIGCDKTASWAIAAVPEKNHAATIQLRAELDQSSVSSLPYAWHTSGSVQTRAGPRQGTDNPLKKLNQCLFVRTMNLKMGTNEWRALAEQIGQARHRPVSTVPPLNIGFNFLDTHSLVSAQWDDMAVRANDFQQQRDRASVTLEPPELVYPRPFKHASDLLHNIMLSMYPEAKMAITEDDELLHHFRSLDPNDPTSTPSHHQIVDRLTELYEIKYDGVVVYLEKKQNPAPPSGEDAAKHDSDSEDQT